MILKSVKLHQQKTRNFFTNFISNLYFFCKQTTICNIQILPLLIARLRSQSSTNVFYDRWLLAFLVSTALWTRHTRRSFLHKKALLTCCCISLRLCGRMLLSLTFAIYAATFAVSYCRLSSSLPAMIVLSVFRLALRIQFLQSIRLGFLL